MLVDILMALLVKRVSTVAAIVAMLKHANRVSTGISIRDFVAQSSGRVVFFKKSILL